MDKLKPGQEVNSSECSFCVIQRTSLHERAQSFLDLGQTFNLH